MIYIAIKRYIGVDSMKKKLITIISCLLAAVFGLGMFSGCELLETDNRRDMEQVVAEVNIGADVSSLNDMFATVFIGIYPLSLFMLFLPVNHSEAGLLGIMLVIAVPVMTDTMAYFTGMALGKRKLCPQISPKKTVAGAVGGVIGGIIGALIVFFLFDFSSAMSVFPNAGSMELIPGNLYGSLGLYIALGIVGGVLSELGDLAASWIKRKAGIKDFGKIFPGHGGIMDRLDSILFMLPLVYLVFAVSGIC